MNSSFQYQIKSSEAISTAIYKDKHWYSSHPNIVCSIKVKDILILHRKLVPRIILTTAYYLGRYHYSHYNHHIHQHVAVHLPTWCPRRHHRFRIRSRICIRGPLPATRHEPGPARHQPRNADQGAIHTRIALIQRQSPDLHARRVGPQRMAHSPRRPRDTLPIQQRRHRLPAPQRGDVR